MFNVICAKKLRNPNTFFLKKKMQIIETTEFTKCRCSLCFPQLSIYGDISEKLLTCSLHSTFYCLRSHMILGFLHVVYLRKHKKETPTLFLDSENIVGKFFF